MSVSTRALEHLAARLASPVAVRALTAALAALIIVRLGVAIRPWLPTRATPQASAVTLAPPLPGGRATLLFGNPPVATADGEEAPQTQIPLVLLGTIARRDPTQGHAIIGPTAEAAHVVPAGQAVSPGITLHEVYLDRVVLDRGGVLETLRLPRATTGGGEAPRTGAATPVPAPRPIAETVQRLAQQGPEVIGDIMRPMPNYAGGQLHGFRLYPGRDRQKFGKLGLQAGDLVTQVNGVPLADAQHGLETLRTLGGATTAIITVERNGQPTTLTVDASQLAGLDGNTPAAPGSNAPNPNNPD